MPFTRTQKGKILPRDFVIAACRLADKNIPKRPDHSAISEEAVENAMKEEIKARRAAAKIAKARRVAKIAKARRVAKIGGLAGVK
jgi:hypothetical protein